MSDRVERYLAGIERLQMIGKKLREENRDELASELDAVALSLLDLMVEIRSEPRVTRKSNNPRRLSLF
jgi:hypothetical protein